MDKLKFISEQMESIGIPYEFMEWTSEITYPYYVGEITEDTVEAEDGEEHSTMLLTGFSRGKMIDLIKDKDKIKSHFPPVYGRRGQTDGGAIAVFFDGFFPIPSGEADLYKIQINLQIIEMKGAV